LYFLGKIIKSGGQEVAIDRLGSVRWRGGAGQFRYLPYGEEHDGQWTADGRDKFGTYFRDAGTGFDYADQRYHWPGQGRFLTPDPYQASGGVAVPQSWNRYAYVGGDPINFLDSRGLVKEIPGGEGSGAGGGGFIGPSPFDQPFVPGPPPPAEPLSGGGSGAGPAASAWDPTRLAGFTEAFSMALSALALPGCAKHFGGTPSSLDPSTVLAQALAGPATGSRVHFGFTTNQHVGAITMWRGHLKVTEDSRAYYSSDGKTKVQSTNAEILINESAWNNSSDAGRARLLIHELGHAFNILIGAGGSDFIYDGIPSGPNAGKPDPSAQDINGRMAQDCIRD
jgi:RHS repeat-associated protein